MIRWKDPGRLLLSLQSPLQPDKDEGEVPPGHLPLHRKARASPEGCGALFLYLTRKVISPPTPVMAWVREVYVSCLSLVSSVFPSLIC
jgi:hypothetical protein